MELARGLLETQSEKTGAFIALVLLGALALILVRRWRNRG